MKGKKLFAIIIMVIVALSNIAFVGCRKDDGRVKVSFWFWGSQPEIEVYDELIETYMELNKDVNIVSTHYASEVYMNKFRSETKKPDVFFMPDTDFVQWANSGAMLELDNYITDEDIQGLWEEGVNEYYYNRETKKLGKSEGAHFYGFPKDLGPVTLAYNKKVLDQQIKANGLNSEDVYKKLDKLSPLTWVEFAELCQSLTADQDKNDSRQIFGIPYYEMDVAMYSGGADYFNKSNPKQHGIDEAFIQAISYIVRLATYYQVMPTARLSGGNAYEMFTNGRCIFTWIGPWDNADFWKDQELEYDIIPVPYNSEIAGAHSTSMIGSMCYGISSQSKVKEQAIKFAKWLSASTESQTKSMYLGQQVPNIKSLANSYISDEGDWNVKTATVFPKSRSLFIDIMDGNSDYFGYWAEKGKTDVIDGKTRALYYTYGSTWKDNFTDYMNTAKIWEMAEVSDITNALISYRERYQQDLNEMYSDWGA